jgi:hypothetical protein
VNLSSVWRKKPAGILHCSMYGKYIGNNICVIGMDIQVENENLRVGDKRNISSTFAKFDGKA